MRKTDSPWAALQHTIHWGVPDTETYCITVSSERTRNGVMKLCVRYSSQDVH